MAQCIKKACKQAYFRSLYTLCHTMFPSNHQTEKTEGKGERGGGFCVMEDIRNIPYYFTWSLEIILVDQN